MRYIFCNIYLKKKTTHTQKNPQKEKNNIINSWIKSPKWKNSWLFVPISTNYIFHYSKQLICIRSFTHHACTTRLWGWLCKERVLIGCSYAHLFFLLLVTAHRGNGARWLLFISLSSHGDLYDNLPRITVQGEWQREGGRERGESKKSKRVKKK